MGIGGAVLALPASVFLAVKSIEDIAFDLIVNELHYLKLDKDGVKKYVRDYLHRDKPDFLSKLKWRSYYLLNFNSNDSDNVKYLISYYLLSSDFFINKILNDGVHQKVTSDENNSKRNQAMLPCFEPPDSYTYGNR